MPASGRTSAGLARVTGLHAIGQTIKRNHRAPRQVPIKSEAPVIPVVKPKGVDSGCQTEEPSYMDRMYDALSKAPVGTNNAQNAYTNKANVMTVKSAELISKPPFVLAELQTTCEKVTPGYFFFSKPNVSQEPAITNGGCDVDLVYRLKMFAAFQTRSMQLATTLKQRCIKILDEYDMTKFSEDEKYSLVMHAVAEAMVVDPLELMMFERLKEANAQLQVFKQEIANFQSSPHPA